MSLSGSIFASFTAMNTLLLRPDPLRLACWCSDDSSSDESDGSFRSKQLLVVAVQSVGATGDLGTSDLVSFEATAVSFLAQASSASAFDSFVEIPEEISSQRDPGRA